MYEDEDAVILKQLRKKKHNLKEIVNKRNIDRYELDKVFGGDF